MPYVDMYIKYYCAHHNENGDELLQTFKVNVNGHRSDRYAEIFFIYLGSIHLAPIPSKTCADVCILGWGGEMVMLVSVGQ